MLAGRRGNETYPVKDDEPVMEFFLENSGKPVPEYVSALASRADFWGEDLTKYRGFEEMVRADLEEIRANGMTTALEKLLR